MVDVNPEIPGFHSAAAMQGAQTIKNAQYSSNLSTHGSSGASGGTLNIQS